MDFELLLNVHGSARSCISPFNHNHSVVVVVGVTRGLDLEVQFGTEELFSRHVDDIHSDFELSLLEAII